MRRMVLVVAAGLAIALIGSACAQDDPVIEPAAGEGEHGDHAGHPAGGGDETKTIGGLTANDHGAWDVSNLAEFDLELDDSYFGPTLLKGAAGQGLILNLHNEGDLPHTFTIDEGTVDHELQPGDEGVTADVVFPESGALVFYCRFHRDQGMVGALSVGGSLDVEGAAAMDESGGSGYGYG